jgi:integrase
VCRQEGHAGKSSKTARRLKAAAGIPGRGLAHRLRHTIRTAMSEHGIDRAVSEMILAHKVADDYDQSTLLSQRREALNWWSSHLLTRGATSCMMPGVVS